MNKFPLCERAGLKIYHEGGEVGSVVYADDVEALLEKAPVVTGLNDTSSNNSWWTNTDAALCNHTSSARLIMIEHIQKDTAESLLREFAAYTDWQYVSGDKPSLVNLQKRAKALLGSK